MGDHLVFLPLVRVLVPCVGNPDKVSEGKETVVAP